MSTSPIAPRMLKGAIIGLDPMNPAASVIVFQYNPDTMTRRLDARATGGESPERGEALRLMGPPKETISLAVEFDAADLPLGQIQALLGVYPPMAALEMLLYPKSAAVIANLIASAAGVIEIIPPEAPLTLFVWGPARIVPVRVTGMSFTEEQYDPLLTPTRAKADLSMQVLSYHDLRAGTFGHGLFLAHQIAKEVLATTNAAASVANLAVGFKFP
jgi:hypothetical protein